MPLRTVPEKVEDLDALRAALEVYLAPGMDIAPRTQLGYDSDWPLWVAFCEARGFTPLPAPIEAFRALLGAAATGSWRAGSSKALSSSRLNRVLAAVRHRHIKAGFQVAYERPEHAASFLDARHGYQRTHGKPAKQAKELDIPTVRALLQAWPTPSHRELADKGMLLLALDHGLGAKDLVALEARHVSHRADGGLDLLLARSGKVVSVTCDHAERLPGVTHDCTRCALAIVQASPALSAIQPLFGYELHRTVKRTFSGLAVRWRGLSVTPDAGLALVPDDARHAAGVRRALAAYAMTPKGFAFLRVKVAVACSFAVGLRAGNDFENIQRQHLRRTESGWTVWVPRSKGDQLGKGCSLGLRLAEDPVLCPARWLDEWLLVRDAAAGAARTGQVALCSVTSGGRGLYPDRVSQVLANDLGRSFAALQELAGVSGYTLHSMRRGYATVAEEQGISLWERQRTMRHASIGQTACYTAKKDMERVTRKLADAL